MDDEIELPDSELTSEIIGAAIAVHTALGPGFLESIYEEALCIELTRRNIPYERQRRVIVTYLDYPVGEHRLDLLVAGRVVVELKAARDFDPKPSLLDFLISDSPTAAHLFRKHHSS